MSLPPLIDTDEVLDITLHQHQERAVFSKKRITALISGIQGGKTRVGGLWMSRKIAMHDEPKNTFIVAGPNFKLMEKSTIPWMLSLLKGCGTYDRNKYRFNLNGGATLWFGSMTDNDSVEGATNVKGIWIDEAGKLRYQAWINLLARSSFSQCDIFLTTTPYALNWLYKEIYLPWQQGTRDDIDVIQFRSCDNPYFPKEEYELQKKLLDPRIFEMKYGGTFQRMAGLVYPELDERNYIENSLPSPQFYNYYAGVDIGFANPFAVVVRAIKKDGTQDIQVAEFYRSFLNPVERTEVIKQMHQVYKFKNIWVDSANPDDIALFVTAGLPAQPVNKASTAGQGSIAFGIQLHQEIIKTKVYRIIPERNPHTLDEYSTYHYEETDDTQEKSIKEAPVKVKDHLMDANRYVTLMTIQERSKAQEPYKPEPTHLQKLLRGDFKKQDTNAWYD